ncbi:MAG: hypothetical protein IJI27_09265, partial [Oscillospiraceae bacterium]|nr:hypothetical protein [Oscillospiraceae bacterium]
GGEHKGQHRKAEDGLPREEELKKPLGEFAPDDEFASRFFISDCWTRAAPKPSPSGEGGPRLRGG